MYQIFMRRYCVSKVLSLAWIMKRFLPDVRTNYAVMKALENMGESAKKVPESLRGRFPAIPFKEMASLRDVVTHHYDGIRGSRTKRYNGVNAGIRSHDGCSGVNS